MRWGRWSAETEWLEVYPLKINKTGCEFHRDVWACLAGGYILAILKFKDLEIKKPHILMLRKIKRLAYSYSYLVRILNNHVNIEKVLDNKDPKQVV